MISRLCNRDRTEGKRRSLIHPVFRICTVLFGILLCALSRNALFTWIIIGCEICEIALLEPKKIIEILKIVAPTMLFTFVIMLPAIFLGLPTSAITVTSKVCASISALAILNTTTNWKEVTGSLCALHIPGIVIFTLDMTIHFLVLLSRFSEQILEAAQMREVSDISWRDSQIGGILGTTFLKAQRVADATTDAMICRGFIGEYHIYDQRNIQWKDWGYVLIALSMLGMFLYLEKI